MEKAEARSIVSQMEDYQKQGYNVLLPSQTIRQVSEMHEPVLEVVRLSVSGGDAYGNDHWDVTKAKEVCLTKQGLMKLAHCAGISWDWSQTRRIDTMLDRNYIAYQALGALQRSDGRWIPLKASYEIDLEVVEEELRILYEKKATALLKKRPQDGGLTSDEDAAKYIEYSVKRELLRKRKHKLRLAETGAMNAVIRALLATKSVYKKGELEKPFVVPRIIFKPDMADPDIRRALVVTGLKGIQSTFGITPPAAFSGEPIEVPAHTNGDTVEHGPVDREALPPPSEAHAENSTRNTAKDAENSQGPAPFSDAPVQKLAEIKSLEDLETIKEAETPGAIRRLMERRSYPETLLKNRKIEDWKKDDQFKFVKLLLEKMPEKD